MLMIDFFSSQEIFLECRNKKKKKNGRRKIGVKIGNLPPKTEELAAMYKCCIWLNSNWKADYRLYHLKNCKLNWDTNLATSGKFHISLDKQMMIDSCLSTVSFVESVARLNKSNKTGLQNVAISIVKLSVSSKMDKSFRRKFLASEFNFYKKKKRIC